MTLLLTCISYDSAPRTKEREQATLQKALTHRIVASLACNSYNRRMWAHASFLIMICGMEVLDVAIDGLPATQRACAWIKKLAWWLPSALPAKLKGVILCTILMLQQARCTWSMTCSLKFLPQQILRFDVQRRYRCLPSQPAGELRRAVAVSHLWSLHATVIMLVYRDR
jgi:hypothetical protein